MKHKINTIKALLPLGFQSGAQEKISRPAA